jgi:hypothetical protein
MILCLISLLLNCVLLVSAQTRQQRLDASDALARRNGTLHDAAKAVGGRYVTNAVNLDGWIEYADVKAIGRDSSVVVIGTPVDNICKLTADGKDIQTLYQFRVEEGLKGRFKQGDTLTVALPGGRVSFDDGYVAQVNTPHFKRMVNGERYLLFLRGKRNDETFTSTGGSQGIFELRADGTVGPHARTQAIAKNAGRTQQEFIEEARHSIGEDSTR